MTAGRLRRPLRRVRPDHLTFLVLAGAVVLVAFALEAVPALLPPVLHSADRNRRVSGAQRPQKRAGGTQGSKGHLGAPGALAAQERTERGNPRAGRQTLIDRLSLGGK